MLWCVVFRYAMLCPGMFVITDHNSEGSLVVLRDDGIMVQTGFPIYLCQMILLYVQHSAEAVHWNKDINHNCIITLSMMTINNNNNDHDKNKISYGYMYVSSKYAMSLK